MAGSRLIQIRRASGLHFFDAEIFNPDAQEGFVLRNEKGDLLLKITPVKLFLEAPAGRR